MAARKKGGRKKKAAGGGAGAFARAFASVLLIAALVGAGAYLAWRFIPAGGTRHAVRAVPERSATERPAGAKHPSHPAHGAGHEAAPSSGPKPENLAGGGPEGGKAAPRPGKTNLPPPPGTGPEQAGGRPLLAIIIDDLGYHPELDRKFALFPAPLTLAVMPHGPGAAKIADAGHDAGKTILAHIPMEPLGYPKDDPGPGALLSGMDSDKLTDTLRDDVARVPHAVGVNNHMGSRLTGDSAALYPIFTVLKKDGLFFVDSVTTPRSKVAAAAAVFQLPTARRDVFLDNEQSPGAVAAQVERALALAAKHGSAVVIGHPHPVTYEVLSRMLPEILEKVKIVPVSELVR